MKKTITYLTISALMLTSLISCATTGEVDNSALLEAEKEITPANLVVTSEKAPVGTEATLEEE